MHIEKYEFYSYVASLVGIDHIDDNTIFFDDLGIAGLDCSSLMLAISNRYNFDLSEYDERKYLIPETIRFIDVVKNIYSILFQKKRLIGSTFTAKHLFNVVVNGKWTDPIVK